MSGLFRLSGAASRDPRIEAWFAGAARLDPGADALFPEPADALRQLARTWFEHFRGCGPDVREILHDRCPFVCVDDAAFGYVNAFSAHVNVGFFQGASLKDPAGLLQGSGKRMRHVKLRWAEPVNDAALGALIEAAYRDMRLRLKSSA